MTYWHYFSFSGMYLKTDFWAYMVEEILFWWVFTYDSYFQHVLDSMLSYVLNNSHNNLCVRILHRNNIIIGGWEQPYGG